MGVTKQSLLYKSPKFFKVLNYWQTKTTAHYDNLTAHTHTKH